MKTLILSLLSSAGSLAFALAAPESSPAIAVMIEVHENPRPSILIAVWPDGTIIWSGDQVRGGPPFRQGKTDAGKLAGFLSRLEKEGIFKKYADILHTGPDSSYHLIRLVSGKSQARIGSWHELFESSPKLVVTSRGVSALTDKTRDEELQADKQSYRDFRKNWKEIRTFTSGLIPEKSEPYREVLELHFPE